MLLLIRHAESTSNAQKLVQGQLNIPLSERGRAQAKALAEKIYGSHPDIAAIYSSDLDRAYYTAQASAERFGLDIEKRIQLREIGYGEAEGISWHEKIARYAAHDQELDQLYSTRKERWDHTSVPGSESYNQLLQRGSETIAAIARAHPGEKIAIFTHGRLVKTLVMEILDSRAEFDFENCAIAYLSYSPDNPDKPFKLLKIEDTPAEIKYNE